MLFLAKIFNKMNNLFKLKPINDLIKEAEDPSKGLKRTLTSTNLISLGIGAIIGTGIFAVSYTHLHIGSFRNALKQSPLSGVQILNLQILAGHQLTQLMVAIRAPIHVSYHTLTIIQPLIN